WRVHHWMEHVRLRRGTIGPSNRRTTSECHWNCCAYSGASFFMVAFEHGLVSVIAAALVSGAGMGLLSPALTVVVQNSVPVDRMGSATTSQQFIRQIGAALGVSAFVLAATVGGFRLGLVLMIAVSAGTFACVLALPAHSL